jgi:hypothetical protein
MVTLTQRTYWIFIVSLLITLFGIFYIYHVRACVYFYGTLTVDQNTEYRVDKVTIAGLHERIKVYPLPQDYSIDPTSRITYLDFKDIDTLVPWVSPADPASYLYIFNNHKYREIVVHWKDRSKKGEHFLLEADRPLCYTLNNQKQTRLFDCFLQLKIGGYYKV